MSKGIEIFLGKSDAFENLKDALVIEPNITFDVRQDGAKALIEFKEKLKWNETFYLIINGGKFKERKIEVKNNAEELRPPRLEFAVFEADGKTIILDEQDNYQNVSFPLADYPAGQEIDFPIWFVYSISGAAGRVDKISAMEATGVNANFCASVSLKTVKALSQEEFDMTSEFFCSPSVRQKILSLQAQGKRLSLVDFGAVFANKEAASKPARGLLEFKVSKKLCDDMKNFMEESAALSCNKN